MKDLLTAGAPIAISIAVIILSITLFCIILAVFFGGLEVEIGGKLITFKATKRPKLTQPIMEQISVSANSDPANLTLEPAEVLIHEPISQDTKLPSDHDHQKNDGSDESFWKWVSAKTLAELDSSVEEAFQNTKFSDLEFWRTQHLLRREQLGAPQARNAMTQIAVDNPTWALPHARMLDWSIDDHDYASARIHMNAGLQRHNSPHIGEVISSGVRLIYKVDGRQAAFAFALHWSKAGPTNAIRAMGLIALSGILKDAGDPDGSFVASEYASIINPTSDDFSLAYAYSKTSNRWTLSLWHYLRDIRKTESNGIARNNIGVIYSKIDKALAIKTYELAKDEGDVYAPANLAHLLVSDGYPAMALKLLDATDDPGTAAENHASARAEALAAQRRIDEKAKEVLAAMEVAVGPYRTALANALRFSQHTPNATVKGMFATTSRDVIADADGSNVRCQVRDGPNVYQGTLQDQITCFAGWLSTGGGGALSQEVAQFTLLQEGNGSLRLFRWPKSSGLDDHFSIYELHAVEELPELAPSPTQQIVGLLDMLQLPKPN